MKRKLLAAAALALPLLCLAALFLVAPAAVESHYNTTARRPPYDATGLAHVTEALIDAGFGDDEIDLVMGGNVFRLLAEALPR